MSTSTSSVHSDPIQATQFAILGALYHTPIKGQFEHHAQALTMIDQQGNIQQVLTPSDNDYPAYLEQLEGAGKLQRLSPSQYLLPGMIDLHIHASQWPQAGKGLDLPLYDWLQNYTFPLEAKYSDLDFAQRTYQQVVQTTLANGTTSAVYFATIHNDASVELAKTCLNLGQRGFVGKISMDDASQCPDFYIEETKQGLADVEAFIQQVRALEGNEQQLVSPVITPRFVPSCTAEMLQGLGDLAQKYQCHVQTHCSESDWARDYSQQQYGKTDIELYQHMGLLTRKTVLAHSIFLTDSDCDTIKEVGASIAHCPLSNMYFANAAMKSREILDKDLQVGLGTDIAGAPIPSIFHACLDAVSHSRVREDGTNTHLPPQNRGETGSRISFLEAYWMATVGGGLALDQKLGLFKTGYAFDALVVDTEVADADLWVQPEYDSPTDILEKLIVMTRRNNITQVWVQGQLVVNKR